MDVDILHCYTCIFYKNLASKDGIFYVTNENSSMYIGGGT